MDVGHIYYKNVGAKVSGPEGLGGVARAVSAMKQEAARDIRGEGFMDEDVRLELELFITDGAGGEEVKVGGTAELGYLHCGPAGAGHFVKMVHNGIEYGLMAAYAEGLNVIKNANVGKKGREAASAEVTPLRHPEHFQYDFDLAEITELWRRGSVVASWLLDLTASALAEDPDLAKVKAEVPDSGEGRWTVLAAIEAGVPAMVLTASLYQRFTSRGEDAFACKVLQAMRRKFGGH